MQPPADWRRAIEATIEALPAELDRFIDEVADVPAIRRMPREAFSAQLERAGRAVLSLHLDPDGSARRDDMRREGIERFARLGVTLDEFFHVQTAGRAAVWRALVSAAEKCDLSRDVLAFAGVVQTRFMAELTPIAIDVYRSIEAERLRAEAQRRDRALFSLLSASSEDAVKLDLARSLGLSPDVPYAALRARARSSDASARVETCLRDAARTSSGVVGTFGGDTIAVLEAPDPFPDIREGIVAIGPSLGLAELSRSFGIATRVLEAAHAFGAIGAVRLSDLGPRLAVFESELVGNEMIARYLAPLDELGAFGETLRETLSVLLEENLAIDETAARMFVHRNSVHHRLARYRAVTGADPGDATDMIGIWWALARERCTSGRGVVEPQP